MSLLLDLLKLAHTVYKNMEDTRELPYLDSLVPSFVPRGLSSKAHILEDAFTYFLNRLLAEPSITHDQALANAILKLEHPDSEKNTLATTSNEAKDDSSEKKKLNIILHILKTCAYLETGSTDADVAIKSLDEIKPDFETAFANDTLKSKHPNVVREANYFLYKAYEFIKLTPDLKNITHLKQRFLDTEIEAGQKTQKMTELETTVKDMQTKDEERELLLAQMTLKNLSLAADNNKQIEAQKQYDVEIINLKKILYSSEKHLTLLEQQTTLDRLKKIHEELKITHSEDRAYAKKAQAKIVELQTKIAELQKINSVLEASQSPTESKAASSSTTEDMQSLSITSRTPPMPVTPSAPGGVFSSFRTSSLFGSSNRGPICGLNNNSSANAQNIPGHQQIMMGLVIPPQTKLPGFSGPK
jgi:hypothetical protein